METESRFEYEVFLNFRGPDVRRNFANFLYTMLMDHKIHVFKDEEELKVGENIGRSLLTAIERAQIYIPIFSRDYANSPWCLREVAHMVECTSKSNGKKVILPIFYYVDPTDVKLKTQLYKRVISRHKMKFAEELKRWENALVEVAHIKGWHLNEKSDARLGQIIKSIVKEVELRLRKKHVDVPKNLVKDHHQINAIIEKLDVDSGGVRYIGIHGMGGIGKTTLAKVVFNILCYDFDSVCFLSDIRESLQPDLINLQKKLLSNICGPMTGELVRDIRGGMKLMQRCCHMKVLIVLDNVDKEEQLEKLVGNSDWFGSGSRIIITTRDKSILMTRVDQHRGILEYEAQSMKFDRALQLFYKHAFRSDCPIEDLDALSKSIVDKVDRLPLAIEVIGSFLYCGSSTLEPHFDKRNLWEGTLTKLNRGPFEDVRDALMISYEGLEDDQKEVFLDIACLFTNEDKTYPIMMWDDCNYIPHIAISILLQRSLIKIGHDDKFWMHDQVRDLGRYIILKEYPHKERPRKFSRVWTHEDVVKLLESKERNEDVKALSLTSNGCSRNIAPGEFAALPNLRFLRVKGIGIFGNFENLHSKLRWLFPQRCQSIFSANNFHFGNLVMLDLSDSNIEDGWGGWSQMKMINLKVLNLAGCIRLKRTPDFSNFMSLKMLILAQCVKLSTIHSSIGKLKSLGTLNIKGCSLLGELPVEIGSLQSLTEIIMPQNFQPFKLPETFGNLESLSSFVLDNHPRIIQLPSTIGGLVKLTHLSLRGCVSIKELPWSIGEMELLVKLDLAHSGIIGLPDSIGYLKKLKVIGVNYTMIRKFPHTIGQVKMLEELHAKECQHLIDVNMEEIGKLSYLRLLDFSYTHVSRFPPVLCFLSHLQTLKLCSSHLQEIPDLPSSLSQLHIQAHHFPSIPDLSKLVSLDYLELYRLSASIEEPGPIWANNLLEEQLIDLPPSDLSTLKLRGISLLPPFSNLKELADLCVMECQMLRFSVSPDLIHLTKLKLSECELLLEIAGLSRLKNLRRLDLNKLERLVKIQGLSELKSLRSFHISHCHMIERLSNLSQLDKLLWIEIEDCPKIKFIEGLKGLESLEFHNHGRNVLEILLDGERWIWLSHSAP